MEDKTLGIVVHTSANVKLHNNITWAKFADEWAFQTFGAISNLEKRRNLIEMVRESLPPKIIMEQLPIMKVTQNLLMQTILILNQKW